METKRGLFQVHPRFFELVMPELIQIRVITAGEKAAIMKTLEDDGPNMAANMLFTILAANEEGGHTA